MTLINRIKRLWLLSEEPKVNIPVEDISEPAPVEIPFFTFPCSCGEKIILQPRLDPAQVAVIICDNCGESWSIYLPPIEKYKTVDFEKVWKFTSEKAPIEES